MPKIIRQLNLCICMDDYKYNLPIADSATLEFLTSSKYKTHIKKNQISLVVDDSELNFYRKRIISFTKEMFKTDFKNDKLKVFFNEYTRHLITFFKDIDTHDVIQTQHILPDTVLKETKILTVSPLSVNDELSLIRKSVSVPGLDNYVIKKTQNKGRNKMIVPQIIDVNLRDPMFKLKGVTH